MHNIKRVRKVKASQASKQALQRFDFDSHYPLSALYQQEMDQGVIPRLVGTQCKQDEGNQREDYAIWHWMWLGRVPHLFRAQTLAMRLLLGLGRP